MIFCRMTFNKMMFTRMTIQRMIFRKMALSIHNIVQRNDTYLNGVRQNDNKNIDILRNDIDQNKVPCDVFCLSKCESLEQDLPLPFWKMSWCKNLKFTIDSNPSHSNLGQCYKTFFRGNLLPFHGISVIMRYKVLLLL